MHCNGKHDRGHASNGKSPCPLYPDSLLKGASFFCRGCALMPQLLSIEYIDLAEAAISTLLKLSREQGAEVLASVGVFIQVVIVFISTTGWIKCCLGVYRLLPHQHSGLVLVVDHSFSSSNLARCCHHCKEPFKTRPASAV